MSETTGPTEPRKVVASSPLIRGLVEGSVAPVDDELVSKAAAELSMMAPKGFRFFVTNSGEHTAMGGGTSAGFKAAVAIMRRLDGIPVRDCLAVHANHPVASDERPEWEPPEDWTDTDALLAYLEKRKQHPEWPRVQNGALEHLEQAAVWLLDTAAAGILGPLLYGRAKALVQRWRAAGNLSRDDATHAAEMALAVRCGTLGLEAPNLQTLTRRTFQTKDNGWLVVFEGVQLAAIVEVPSGDPNERPIEVNLLHHRGIGNQP